MNEFKYSEIQIGHTETFTKQITTQMEDSFRAISGDDNPLHRDDEYARSVSDAYTQHVAFGMLTASLYSTLAGMYIPGKYSLIHSFDELKFTKPVYAGDTLTVTGTVEEKIDGLNLILVKAKITNQNNKSVSSARIKILVLK